MKICHIDYDNAQLQFSLEELQFVCNAVNEVCNGIEVPEFETRLGVTSKYAELFLKSISTIIEDIKR